MFIALFAVLTCIVAVVIAFARPTLGSEGGGYRITSPHVTIELILLGLGIAINFGGLIWARRTGHYVPRWRSILSAIPATDRRSAMRQIGDRERADLDRLPILVALAKQSRSAAIGAGPLYVGTLLIVAGVAEGASAPTIDTFALIASAAVVGSTIRRVFRYRAEGRFIRKYDVPTGETAAPAAAVPNS